MSTFLINHALQHVWCAPRMDQQARIKPARICPRDGVWNKAKIMWSTYKLPTQKERYYVYQIGQLRPSLMGLLDTSGQWIPFSETCKANNLMVDIYSEKGIQLPRFQSYYMVTPDNNLVIAVKEQKKINFNLRDEDLYIRVYSNAFYNAQRYNPDEMVIDVVSGIPRNNTEILALQVQYESYLNRPGAVWAYVNGYHTNKIDLLSVAPSDVVEIIYDSSVLRTIVFDVADLRTFDSLLDKKRKFLLHYAGVASDDIDYHDDIDFYLVKPTTNNRHKGIYFHRNDDSSIRMVTHRDYSMSVQTLLAFANYQEGWNNSTNLQIIAYIRKGGWNRTLVPENNRINELYKLDDEDIRNAMLGINSVVPNWRADVLEQSTYAEIMRSDVMQLPQAMVENAYGYNAIAYLIGKTPSKTRVESLLHVVDVPYALRKNSTAYEYDAAGKLLGWYPHINSAKYTTRNELTDIVEQIVGLSDSRIDETYGAMQVVLDPAIDYRMYVCDIVDGVPNNKWRDVTGNGGMYVISANNVLTWAVDPTKTYTMVRSNAMNLAYQLQLSVSNGLLKFDLTQKVLRNNQIATQTMQVPMGTLELFLNGRKLIQNLDYYIKFPTVVITNKKYLVKADKQAQSIAVRCTGFCDSAFQMEPPTDYGFIQHGVLSKNNRYDLRDDRIQHISVDGYIYDKSELLFAESDLAVRPIDATNGAPYIVQDLLVPFRNLTLGKTLEMRERSRMIDKSISQYMTLKSPEMEIDSPSAIPAKYPVVSPFISRILADLVSGVLWDDRLKQHYSTALVKELCTPYEWLIQYDPKKDGQEPDPYFVEVHPHPWTFVVDATIYQYKFLKMVVDYYLGGSIDLSNFVRIHGM